MQFQLRSVAVLALSAWFAAPTAVMAEVAPALAEPSVSPLPAVADYFRSPALYRPVVNRAGTRVAALVDGAKDLMGIRFFDLTSGKQTGVDGSFGRDIDDLEWLDNDHVIITTTREKIYADGVFVIDVRDPSKTIAIARNSAVQIVSVPRRKPMNPVVWLFRDAYDEGSDRGAVQLNANRTVDPPRNLGIHKTSSFMAADDAVNVNGTAASIAYDYPVQKMGITESYFADRDGELAYAVASVDGRESLLMLRDNRWIRSPVDLDRYEMVGAGDTPDEIIAVGPRQDGKPRALVRLDPKSGTETAVLYQDDLFDPQVIRIMRHPASGLVIGVRLARKTTETIWFDEEHKELQREMNRMFPGLAVLLLGSDEAEKRLVIATFSDRSPIEYHYIDVGKKTLQRIASSAPWLDSKKTCSMQSMSYKTRDGFKVEGYLTLPPGASKASPAPLVVLVHGGPWSRDLWGWDSEAQFLSSRGYAVFQPNYRGSSGYSWSFPAGADWTFRKMHDDVTDGVRKLTKSGLVDPMRIAIMGASFGGYLAMCGAAYEPDLYRCAITEAGVFDWASMLKQARRDRYESVRYDFFRRNLGDPTANSAELAELSPLTHVDQVKIPVLVAHGAEDEVVSIEQSEALVKRLERYKVPHQVLLKRGEAHGMFKLDNRVEFYTAVERFLASYMAAPAVAAK